MKIYNIYQEMLVKILLFFMQWKSNCVIIGYPCFLPYNFLNRVIVGGVSLQSRAVLTGTEDISSPEDVTSEKVQLVLRLLEASNSLNLRGG